VNLKL